MNAKPDLSSAIRALAAQVSDDPDDHPEAEDLAALATGTLTGFRLRAVEDHVAGCPECTAIVADLTEPSEEEGWVGKEGEPGRAEEAAWVRFERELGRAGGRVLPFPPEAPAVAESPRRSGRWASLRRWGVAASLLLCAGLGGWVAVLREDLEVALGPRSLGEPIEVSPAGTATRGFSAAPGTNVVRLSDQSATLVLAVRGEHLSPPAAVEFFDARGRSLARLGDLPIADGDFAVAVSLAEGWLRPGRYEARLTAGGLAEPAIFPLAVE